MVVVRHGFMCRSIRRRHRLIACCKAMKDEARFPATVKYVALHDDEGRNSMFTNVEQLDNEVPNVGGFYKVKNAIKSGWIKEACNVENGRHQIPRVCMVKRDEYYQGHCSSVGHGNKHGVVMDDNNELKDVKSNCNVNKGFCIQRIDRSNRKLSLNDSMYQRLDNLEKLREMLERGAVVELQRQDCSERNEDVIEGEASEPCLTNVLWIPVIK